MLTCPGGFPRPSGLHAESSRLAGRIWSELRRSAGHGGLLLALVSGVGCGSDRDEVRLEVYSWWTKEPERLAFESVISLHEKRATRAFR